MNRKLLSLLALLCLVVSNVNARIYLKVYAHSTSDDGYVYVSLNNNTPSQESDWKKDDESSADKTGTRTATFASYFAAKPKAGYKFVGWYDSENGGKELSTNLEYKPNLTGTSTSSSNPTIVHYYARFEKMGFPAYDEVAEGKYYLYNVGQKRYLTSGNTLTENLSDASVFELSASNNATIKDIVGNVYVAENKGGSNWGESQPWTIEYNTATGGYYIHHQITDRYDRYIHASSATVVDYARQGMTDANRTWQFISAEQVGCSDTDSDASDKIKNANGNYVPQCCWTTEGVVNRLHGDNNTGKDGKVGIFEVSDWWASSFDCSMSQTITDLPNGCYRLTVDCQASAGSTLKIFAGNNETTTVSNNEGWVTYEVIAEVTDGTLTIGARGTANSQYQWTNVDNFKLYKIDNVTVNISAAGWATFVSEYNTEPADGVTAYAGKINPGYTLVNLTEVTSIPANTAVILKGEQGTYEFPVVASATDITDEISNLTYSATDTPVDGTQYILAKKGDTVGFYRATTGTIAPYKAFFVDNTVPAGNGTTPAKFFVLDETTSISDITTNVSTGVIYNLAGQPVDANYKGIVIKNGKKYLNK